MTKLFILFCFMPSILVGQSKLNIPRFNTPDIPIVEKLASSEAYPVSRKRHKFPFYGLAVACIVSEIASSIIVNSSYHAYNDEINMRNVGFENWYYANYGKIYTDNSSLQPISLTQFAPYLLPSDALLTAGGVLFGILGRKQALRNRYMAQSSQLSQPISLKPVVNPRQGWSGVSVCYRF